MVLDERGQVAGTGWHAFFFLACSTSMCRWKMDGCCQCHYLPYCLLVAVTSVFLFFCLPTCCRPVFRLVAVGCVGFVAVLSWTLSLSISFFSPFLLLLMILLMSPFLSFFAAAVMVLSCYQEVAGTAFGPFFS